MANLAQGIFNFAKRLFGKVRLIHDLYHDKKRTGITLGIEWKGLFCIALDVKVEKKVAVISFKINKRKYRLYLACTKVFTIFKSALTFIKGIICGNQEIIDGFGALSISKKEYKTMKENAKNIKKDIKKAVEKTSRPIYVVYQDVSRIKRAPAEDRISLEF